MTQFTDPSFAGGALLLCAIVLQITTVASLTARNDASVQHQIQVTPPVTEAANLTHEAHAVEPVQHAIVATRQVPKIDAEMRDRRKTRRDAKRQLARARLAPLLSSKRTAFVEIGGMVSGSLTPGRGARLGPKYAVSWQELTPAQRIERARLEVDRFGQPVKSVSCDPIVLQFAAGMPVNFHRSNRRFDLGQDPGFLTDWPEPETPWLALDRDGNGRIDDGTELFGDSTVLQNGHTAVQGFEALAELDSNADGVINHEDTLFSSLLVWSDANRNRLSETSEMGSLSAFGITRIDLQWQNRQVCDNRGNCEGEHASFVWFDTAGVKQRGEAVDVDVVQRERLGKYAMR